MFIFFSPRVHVSCIHFSQALGPWNLDLQVHSIHKMHIFHSALKWFCQGDKEQQDPNFARTRKWILPEKQESTRSDPGENKNLDSATPETGLSKTRTRQEKESGSCQRQGTARSEPGKNKRQ
jgi:hypothetical protein